MTSKRRRWIDGPRWKWLCRVLGHQGKAYYWLKFPSIFGGHVYAWDRLGSCDANGDRCCRCGVNIPDKAMEQAELPKEGK